MSDQLRPAARYRPRLVVMVKQPRPGRVKTRLGRDMGMVPACWWMRHQTARLLRHLRDPRWDLVLAVSPDHAMSARDWPWDLRRIQQGPGDLGDRMGRILRRMPPGPVCIIGADIPDMSRAHIARAFARLGDHDAVFGPAPDGGFWLVGLKRISAVPMRLFETVRWSGPFALRDSVATMGSMRIAMIDTLADVDDIGDLRAYLLGHRNG